MLQTTMFLVKWAASRILFGASRRCALAVKRMSGYDIFRNDEASNEVTRKAFEDTWSESCRGIVKLDGISEILQHHVHFQSLIQRGCISQGTSMYRHTIPMDLAQQFHGQQEDRIEL